MDIDSIMKDGVNLKIKFENAQKVKQKADKVYKEAKANYAGWVEVYGALVKTIKSSESSPSWWRQILGRPSA